MIFEATILVKKESELYARDVSVSVDIYPHAPLLIDVGTYGGSAMLSVDEAKQLIEVLQKAIELIEKNSHVPS